MKQVLCGMVQISVLLSAGCLTSAEDDVWLDRTQLSMIDERGAETGDDTELRTDWVELSPGVWGRSRPNGGFVRMGFGIEGFEFALEQAQQERAQLLITKHAGSGPAMSDRLRANQELIEYLQSSLDAAEAPEELPLKPATLNEVAASSSSSSGVSGSVCGGWYEFDVTFTYGLADGFVDTTATWYEFGPYDPYKKTLHTYAYAEDEFNYWEEDADSYGPFSHSWSERIQSSAIAYLSWNPRLYGRAYVSVTNGCTGFRFYESSNF